MKIFNFGQKKCLHRNITDITQLIQQKLMFFMLLLCGCRLWFILKVTSNFLVKNWMFYFYRGWKGHSEVCFYLKHSAGYFKYPAGCFNNLARCFLTGWVFDLKTSGQVFYIKNSRPSILKHPAGCLSFKHPVGHFTNVFEIWSWNHFTQYLMVLIFLCFWKLTRFLSFWGTCNYCHCIANKLLGKSVTYLLS